MVPVRYGSRGRILEAEGGVREGSLARPFDPEWGGVRIDFWLRRYH
jgi:hypothetical protein